MGDAVRSRLRELCREAVARRRPEELGVFDAVWDGCRITVDEILSAPSGEAALRERARELSSGLGAVLRTSAQEVIRPSVSHAPPESAT